MYRHTVSRQNGRQALRPACGVLVSRTAKHLQKSAVHPLCLSVTLRVKRGGSRFGDACQLTQLFEQLALKVLALVRVQLTGEAKNREEPVIHGPHASRSFGVRKGESSGPLRKIVCNDQGPNSQTVLGQF